MSSKRFAGKSALWVSAAAIWVGQILIVAPSLFASLSNGHFDSNPSYDMPQMPAYLSELDGAHLESGDGEGGFTVYTDVYSNQIRLDAETEDGTVVQIFQCQPGTSRCLNLDRAPLATNPQWSIDAVSPGASSHSLRVHFVNVENPANHLSKDLPAET